MNPISKLFGFDKADKAAVTGNDVMVLERPKALKSEPLDRANVLVMSAEQIAEYKEVSVAVGVSPPNLTIEQLKLFLLNSGITVFSLSEVVRYMDKKANRESHEHAGWEWKPLRSIDASDRYGRDAIIIGSEAERAKDQWGNRNGHVISPASDFYNGNQKVYDRTVPLHALKKVALIEGEKDLKGKVKFFVCDYAPAPQIEYPDPFLMAVVPNASAANGEGRFILDFWDEPGFGIEQMLKSDVL
jgi:hypothetical protein